MATAPAPVPTSDATAELRTAGGTRTERAYAAGGWEPKSPSFPPVSLGASETRALQARLFSLSASPAPLWRLVGFGDPREWLRFGVVLLDVFSGRQESSQKAHQQMEKQTLKPGRCCQSLLQTRKSGNRHAHFLPAAVPLTSLEPRDYFSAVPGRGMVIKVTPICGQALSDRGGRCAIHNQAPAHSKWLVSALSNWAVPDRTLLRFVKVGKVCAILQLTLQKRKLRPRET